MTSSPVMHRRAMAARCAAVVLFMVIALGLGVGPAFASVDATPPTTYTDVNATYMDTATISLTAYDNEGGSGVDKTYYRIDEAGAFVVGLSATVSTVGNHTIEFYSVDLAGNTEATQSARFKVESESATIDQIAPTTTSNVRTSYPTSPARITVTAADNPGGTGVAAVNYRVDGGAVITGASTSTVVVSIAGSGGASHSLKFWAVDVAGNIGVEHTVSFTIGVAPAPRLKISCSRASARIGQTLVLSGVGTPNARMARRRISVMAKMPGRAWSTVGSRILSARATWSYAYRLKWGMPKGVYQFKVTYSSTGKRYSSRVLKVTVK